MNDLIFYFKFSARTIRLKNKHNRTFAFLNFTRMWHKCALLFLILLCSVLTPPRVLAQYESVPESYYLHQQLLNSVQFTEDQSSILTGRWLFYPQQLIQEPSAVLASNTVELPASFEDLMGNANTYGTFIGHFQIPKEFLGRRIAIWIPNQYGAYRVFLNGDPLVRVGTVGADTSSHQTENAPRIAYFVPESEYFTLTIQASSFQSLQGGLKNPMKIGLSRTINQQYQRLMMSIAMICGAVLGIGLFTLMFSAFSLANGGKTKRIFIFGIFIVFLALHNLFSAPYAYTTFLNLSWSWGIRLEYLFSFLAILFFLSYMFLLSSRYLHRWVYSAAMLLLSFNIGVTLWAEPTIFQQLAFYSSFFFVLILANFAYGFYQTLHSGEHYSRINFWAVIILCGTFIHDFLLMLNLVNSIHLSFISTSVYALLIMFQQARNYAYHNLRIERLNQKLIHLNSSLDLKVQERTEQLSLLNEKLEIQIKTDALTGAYNRRALNEEIQRLYFETLQNKRHILVFAMLDVDYFKKYNDHYGHLKGDQILQNLVKVLQDTLPKNAFVARYGGEEFAILLHDIPQPAIAPLMQKVLQAVRDAAFEHVAREDHKQYVTLSIGVAWMTRAQAYTHVDDFMKAADAHLYQAKHAGRDQVVIQT
ncbi:diguanylate cyclase [Acinetobacter towneri]|uniref:diguanylate cyclase n=2 Tax=Acinetobacter towneri TaxID=202956 RepID=A0AB35M194_9GAMM|nr:diguanylate cyclase [Acinetobacter towneri]MDM1730787.1 diguanylate cyclase [Acinetobacter towneri]MDM1733392.1 diguanylate cyclase [Acinetobacter towneri]MDM1736352.1 diguanylate cyclase [Acinetobacter towneri]MDM1738764.1 diguanylate cyclase [Acinetobacter towneri]